MTRPTSPTETAGFTLLEMLTVLTVIAMLSVAMAGRLPGGAPPLGHAASDIARELRGLRADAITTGRDIAVTATGADEARTLSMPEGIAARIVDAAGAETERLIFFGAGGTTGGAVEVSRGAARTRIGVDWLTGTVTRE